MHTFSGKNVSPTKLTELPRLCRVVVSVSWHNVSVSSRSRHHVSRSHPWMFSTDASHVIIKVNVKVQGYSFRARPIHHGDDARSM